jgi:hypothetical protein
MTRTLKSIVALVAAAVIAGQVGARQRAAIEPRNRRLSLLSNSGVTRVLARACGNCHSNHTGWPWYSHVAPVSWWIAQPMREGRENLDFSGWETYSAWRKFWRNRKESKEWPRRLQSEDSGLEVVHPQSAGIDVGNSAHYVAVRPDRDAEPVRRFECFTADLHRMADGLQSCGVKTVAMQSSGVYWIPLYEILEARGFEVHRVNARHTKNLPGRKSDVQESQWWLKLHTYGLLNNSLQPVSEIGVLRSDWRQRAEHVRGAATCIQRMQKALTQMNVHLRT